MQRTPAPSIAILLASALLAGCVSLGDESANDRAGSLSLTVTELEMQLKSDPYRTFAHLRADGRNVFDVTLWRLDRLKRRLDPDSQDAERADAIAVIEFARGRALERLRRYDEALDAYDRVARAGGLLAAEARESAAMADFFAGIGAIAARPETDTAFLEGWAFEWRQIARELRGTEYASVALQEAERLEILHVERLARHRDLGAAVEACRTLIEENRASKLYGRHLIRLGDLYAELARREHDRARQRRGGIDAARYERSLDRALSAYELASETRKPHLRREAKTKIDALIAYHEGVRRDVR